jgi:hypothetical protein
MAEDKKATFGVIEGVLVYAKIAQPDNKFESKDTEYSIGIIVDEDAADAWEEQFAKQPPRKFKVADFETKFKFPCPFEGVKNVYQITLKKDAVVGGEEMYPEFRPKVFLDDAEGERTDITESRLVANGSRGKVSYRITSNKYGTFARLQNVLIKEEDFKEYVSTGSKGAGSEFGDDKPVKKEPARKEATEARKPREEAPEDKTPTKPAAKPVKATKVAKVAEDEIEDSPF